MITTELDKVQYCIVSRKKNGRNLMTFSKFVACIDELEHTKQMRHQIKFFFFNSLKMADFSRPDIRRLIKNCVKQNT